MTNATKCPHTSRRARARGLCGACYVVAQRKGFSEPPENPPYVREMIEEVEFMDLGWEKLEQMFAATRSNLQTALRRAGREDLIRRVHFVTYGAVTRAEIISSLRMGATKTWRGHSG